MKKLLVLFLCSGLIGCATVQTVTGGRENSASVSEKYVATFNYTPPVQNAPISGKVTFTVGKAFYKQSAGSLAWFVFPQFVNLQDAIEQDLSEILTAKGFSVRGPYDSYDLIPFQDKKEIDLLLAPVLELSIALKDQKEALENFWGWEPGTLQTGNSEVTGKVNFEMREVGTHELMWAKPIPIKKFEFPYIVRIPWGKAYTPGKPYNYDPIIDGIAKGIEQQYPEIMGSFYSLLDAEEMAIIKKQVDEIKAKK